MRSRVFQFIGVIAASVLASVCLAAEPGGQHDMQDMAGMDQHAMSMEMAAGSLVEEIQNHDTSGTSAEPDSTPIPMLMARKGAWTLMFHGMAFLSDIQQTGPRGHDKLFSVNWVMPMAQRRLGRGTLTLRTMLSLEPATITGRLYPLLFQQGETAYGRPLVDGQHPHNFFMEVAALYDARLGGNTLLSFYAAPVGDPALGPTAYPHRASASPADRMRVAVLASPTQPSPRGLCIKRFRSAATRRRFPLPRLIAANGPPLTSQR